MNELLNVHEAAVVLRLKPATIRDWIWRRRIPYVKLGRRVFIRRKDVEHLIAANIVPAIGSDSMVEVPDAQ